MNTFNKKSLYVALAGFSALGATGAAQAVSVNADGLGQALIYPYFTVRSIGPLTGAPYNSLLSVVNSTASAKAVKVRFLEGKNSREVLDFNLYLSAKDVWTAAVIPTATGAGIYTPDKSCTQPKVSGDSNAPTLFVNYAYTGSAKDNADTSLDRTREGYVEIIEMGNITDGSTTWTAVTHSQGTVTGTPDCTPLTFASTDTVVGNGGLFGSMSLVNVLAGSAYGYDPIALDGFSQTALWRAAGTIFPNLADVNPKTSVVTNGLNTYVTQWNNLGALTIDPVSAVLMHNNVYNEFFVATETLSGTDWVLTMPTKYAYIGVGSGTNVGKLFQRNFDGNNGSCDDVVITQYDREEKSVSVPGSFSPPPPTNTDSICWEANVVTFNNTSVLGSKNIANIPTTFKAGWVSMNFNGGTVPVGKHQLVGGATTVVAIDPVAGTATTSALATGTYWGLPMVGFNATSFINGTLTDASNRLIQSVYGVNNVHKMTKSIQ
jgi:hypothetical protein